MNLRLEQTFLQCPWLVQLNPSSHSWYRRITRYEKENQHVVFYEKLLNECHNYFSRTRVATLSLTIGNALPKPVFIIIIWRRLLPFSLEAFSILCLRCSTFTEILLAFPWHLDHSPDVDYICYIVNIVTEPIQAFLMLPTLIPGFTGPSTDTLVHVTHFGLQAVRCSITQSFKRGHQRYASSTVAVVVLMTMISPIVTGLGTVAVVVTVVAL
jgi:hypothetical protein